jgi:hypothetical protein
MDEHDCELNVDLESERVVTTLLDGIPGAYETAQLGLEQVEEGKTIPLDDL